MDPVNEKLIRSFRAAHETFSDNTTFTFAKGRWAVPLRGMARNTADNNLPNKLVTFVAEETQSLSCLVAVLVQGLVPVVRDTRVWAWIIFY